MTGIYIHIPFCKQACSYCDFYFVTRTSEREHFVERLLKEIRSYGDSRYASEQIQTIYFGGGTPSLLEPKQIEQILAALRSTFSPDFREITFEVNPDDVHPEFLAALKALGITRLSMGVQTFQPELLQFMNRAHSREEALRCLELIKEIGFKSYTVDLIYGNPGQSAEDLAADLDLLLGFHPPHISAYSLTVESGTRLGKQVELGRLVPPEDENVIAHFEQVNRRLKEQEIHRYEVSNYSRSGHEAVHNSNYWRHGNYLGFGPGAHSFWWDENAYRWENEGDLRAYLKESDIRTKREELSPEQLAEERLIMGLRTRDGVTIRELNERYDYQLSDRQKEYLHRRAREQKLHFDTGIRLTDKGITIADALVLDLVTLH